MERNIPSSIKLQLRQESGFGCAACGNILIEYHHIVPWAQCHDHDPNHMVALCATCHDWYGKSNRKDAYEVKKNPFNKSQKYITNKFINRSGNIKYRVGKIHLNDCNPFLQLYSHEILSIYNHEGIFSINAFFPDTNFNPELKIFENHLHVRSDALYDVQFRGDFLKIQKNKGRTFLMIDFRCEIPEIYFDINILGKRIFHTKTSSNFADWFVVNGTMNVNGGSCFLIGDQRYAVTPTNHAALQFEPVKNLILRDVQLKTFGIVFQ
jgi:hypothetical protein